jgi:hypothetical protein
VKTTPVLGRVLAALCALLAVVPFLLLLPMSILASYIDVKASIEDLIASPNGTPAFVEDSHRRIVLGVVTLLLDILCCVGMWCIVGVALNLLGRRWQLLTWTAAIFAGFGSALIRWSQIGWSMIGPKTDHTFIFMVIVAPIMIGVLGVVGLLISILSLSPQNI